MLDDLRHRIISTNGIRLHAVEAGPEDGRLLILLHGFPELWYGWRHQIEPLAEAGFRVLAPDLRGYHLSDKPAGVKPYGMKVLARDVVGLIDEAGRDRACIVGHDWGGAVAWWLGVRHPERIEKLALLNIPHPVVMRRHLMTHPSQLLRSWYIFFFQLPGLPERQMRADNWAFMARTFRGSSRRGTFSDADLHVYREAWSAPGAATGMINWYRAALRAYPRWPKDPRVRVPTLLLWGTRDRYLSSAMAQPSLDLCDQGRLVLLEEATHWLHHEEPERVNVLLADFFL
ncbi:MAG TPA: alpha/beta hydrolase [Thermoanaerobaculia bacterium]|nr:alpha/beta hydrolase [Thermoanaerobaculia bacterium]